VGKYIEDEKRKRGVRSVSSVLEGILRERRKKAAPKDMNAAISAHYDSLSDEELEDDTRWGEFAESQLHH
jgi:hypothetical protein